MNKFSTLNFDLLEQWVNEEIKSINKEIDMQSERLPSNESVEFLKQFAAGYMPVESKELEFDYMLN